MRTQAPVAGRTKNAGGPAWRRACAVCGASLLAGLSTGCAVQGSGMDSVIRIGFGSSPQQQPAAEAPVPASADADPRAAANPAKRPASEYDGRRIAVLPLRAEIDLVGLSISDLFVTELFKTGRFVLVERSQLSKVLGETEIALSGLTDAKAAEVGSMAGADAVLVGTVAEYGAVANRGKTFPAVGISCRLIDCKSGQVVRTESRSRKADSADIIASQLARQIVSEMCASLAAPAKSGAAAPQAAPRRSGIRLEGFHLGQ